MTPTAGQPTDLDPTLSSLVPRSSWRRNLVLAVLAAAVLAGAFVSPKVLRPTVATRTGGWVWAALPTHQQVVVVAPLDATTWSHVDLRSVGGVPGAEVAGAWVQRGELADTVMVGDPADYDTGLDVLRATFPTLELGSTRLPQRLQGGETAQLIVLWDVVACDALNVQRLPELTLRTALGTTTHEQLDDFLSPAWDVETLRSSGLC